MITKIKIIREKNRIYGGSLKYMKTRHVLGSDQHK
jgi:hypothetical protein